MSLIASTGFCEPKSCRETTSRRNHGLCIFMDGLNDLVLRSIPLGGDFSTSSPLPEYSEEVILASILREIPEALMRFGQKPFPAQISRPKAQINLMGPEYLQSPRLDVNVSCFWGIERFQACCIVVYPRS